MIKDIRDCGLLIRDASAGRKVKTVAVATLWVLLLLGACAPAARAASGSADRHRDGRSGDASPQFDLPKLRSRLRDAKSAEVARACGQIGRPWRYRGRTNAHPRLQYWGQKPVDRAQARALADMLAKTELDTLDRADSKTISCEREAPPAFLVQFINGDKRVYALFRFDEEVVVMFSGPTHLGDLAMGTQADSLWVALRSLVQDDSLLQQSRPVPDSLLFVPIADGRRAVNALPVLLSEKQPVYPDDARRMGIEGEVVVVVLVGRDGAIEDAVISEGPAALRDAALDCAWTAKFDPATTDGKPVAVWVNIPIQFTLR